MKTKLKFYCFIVSLCIGMQVFSQSKDVFKLLNLELPKLQKVKSNVEQGKIKKAKKLLLEYYQNKPNLYFKVSKSDVTSIKHLFPKEVANSIKVANQVKAHYFLFRYEWDMEKTNVPHQFKGEIDWTFTENGDPEWHWMLNRHKYWIDLGKAYYLTGDESYAKTFVNQLTHWVKNNTINKETKWFSWRRIEAGIRCENWIKSFELIKHSKHVTPAFLETFLKALFQHAEFINSAFNNFSKTSNWGVLEFQGLFNASQFLNDFKLGATWQANAVDNLTTCSSLQVLDDGSHWEQSPMYHNEVFHCFMNVVLLAKRNSIKLPKLLVENTKKMAYANIKWQKPNYHQPLLGDSDDTDLRGILSLSVVLFNDGTIKSRANNVLNYENYFIVGKQGALQYNRIQSTLPKFLSVHQKSSGDVFLRSSWRTDASYSCLNFKKIGGGHGHDNILHFSLFANQRDYLVDNGRYTYVDNKWRKQFKSSLNHNTLGVDGLPNSIYNGSWLNKYEARSHGVFSKLSFNFDYAEAENTAYKRLEDPVMIKRRLLFLKPNVWLVFDSFSANKMHTYSQYFNFPNENVKLKSGGIETNYESKNLRIQPIKKIDLQLKSSWYSPEYNLKQKSIRAEGTLKNKGFTSFISVLYFPESTPLSYKKVPIYSRTNKLFKDEDAEAVSIKIDNVEYTLLVVHNSTPGVAMFYEVNDTIVHGEVVLIKKEINGNTTVEIIKE